MDLQRLLSGSSDPIKDLKLSIIDKLSKTRKPIIIDSCLDIALSQIKESFNKELFEMFTEYFKRAEHDPLEGAPDLHDYFHDLCGVIFTVKNKGTDLAESKASTKSTANKTHLFYEHGDLGCCLPCSCITLAGNRVVKDLKETLPVPDNELIKSIEYADVFYDYFIERTDIDKIAAKILSDLEFGGKFPIRYDTPIGLITQVWINEINKGMSSRRKQRTSKSLKTIGMKLDNDYAGLRLSDMQIVPGMNIALRLIVKFKEFYDFRKVVNTIEAIAGKKESTASIASIHKSIELLYRSSEKFMYGTNAYNTVKSIAWKFAGFYLILAASKQIGLPQERLDDIVDAARNMLLLNRTGTPSEKSKARAYIDCAAGIRNLIAKVLAPFPDLEFWSKDDFKNLKNLADIEESGIERFIASFIEATGINLADKKWLQEDIVVSHDLPNKL